MMRLPGLLVLALLGGCTISPPASTLVTLPANPEYAPFAMNGRISTDHHGERHSAGLHWTHLAQSDEILLLSPLGQTVARVYRDEGGATLDEGGKHYQDVDTESLMEQVLGWHLPLDVLHHWVLAMADPETPAQIERADNGQVLLLRQVGWEVRFLKYDGSLPKRMQLSHEDLQVQLLIDEWGWNLQ
jgi:outer membrane lipoprotein LolB